MMKRNVLAKTVSAFLAAIMALAFLTVLTVLACKNPIMEQVVAPLYKEKASPSAARAITAFTFNEPPAAGIITGTDISVTVPLGTDRSSLVPTITHTGASLSPPSGVARNFTGPVTYTVTAANGAATVYTVTVVAALLSLDDVTVYLADAPAVPVIVPLPVAVPLSAGQWDLLLNAIQTAGRLVALDLTASPRGGHDSGGGLYADGTFDPVSTVITGKDRIVSLTLPAAAESIRAGTSSISAFNNFTALTGVSGAHATGIGQYAFRNCTTLATADFPKVTSIGDQAFSNCDDLPTAYFPAVTSIGIQAFYHCDDLAAVDFPKAASIGDWAFQGCGILDTADLPRATSIGKYAFRNCTALATADLSAVTSIGENAFFDTGGTALTVTLPLAAPAVSATGITGTPPTKAVTIKTPVPRTGYDPVWETTFKLAFGQGATINLNYVNIP
jgi:hypothetical protein